MFLSRLSLTITITSFSSVVINVIYVVVSLILVLLGYKSILAQPVLIFLIPLLLLTCMLSLLYACDYNENVEFFMGLFKKKSYDYLLYASAYLINPLLLYVYTKSYNSFIRIWGVLRCFPIINIFLYRKLIKDAGNLYSEIPNKKLIVLYLKGRLLLSIANKNL
jgi:hypothetical protein